MLHFIPGWICIYSNVMSLGQIGSCCSSYKQLFPLITYFSFLNSKLIRKTQILTCYTESGKYQVLCPKDFPMWEILYAYKDLRIQLCCGIGKITQAGDNTHNKVFACHEISFSWYVTLFLLTSCKCRADYCFFPNCIKEITITFVLSHLFNLIYYCC